MSIDRLETLLVEELRDLYDAEKQLVKALPKMAKAASDQELEQAFRDHLEQTREHVQRLEQVFEMFGARPKSKPCKGMKGLVEEGSEMLETDATEVLCDSAIIGAARRVEHYEMAAYSTARSMAETLGNKDAARLLQQTLEEEGEAEKKLSQLARRLFKEAQRAAPAAGRGARGETASTGASSGNQLTRTTTDHEEIRRWAEERGARPACVKGTGRRGDVGMIRLDFPGYSGRESLQPITWDEFFEKFDDMGLALLYQEKTARGQKSNFNKLVSREHVAAAGKKPARAGARHSA